MKPWFVLMSKFGGTCEVCEGHYHKGDLVAWHPVTRQVVHEVCFCAQFHPGNVKSAVRLSGRAS